MAKHFITDIKTGKKKHVGHNPAHAEPIRESDFGPRARQGFRAGTLSAPTHIPQPPSPRRSGRRVGRNTSPGTPRRIGRIAPSPFGRGTSRGGGILPTTTTDPKKIAEILRKRRALKRKRRR